MKIKIRFISFYFAFYSACTIFALVMDYKKLCTLFTVALLWLLSVAPSMAMEEQAGSAIVQKTKGDACYNAGRFSEALEFYTKALDISKNEENERIYYACLGNIGNIYASMDDLKRAVHYYTRGYEASAKSKYIELQWRFAVNLVSAYCQLKDPKSAKAFFQMQIQLPIKGVQQKEYYFLINQAYIAEAENKPQMARYYLQKVCDFAVDHKMDPNYSLNPLVDLGRLYMKEGNVKEALACFRKAQHGLLKLPHQEALVSVYKAMTEAFRQQGQADSAAVYHRRYLSMSDSVFNMSQFTMAGSKLFEYENAETQKQINHLVSQNHIQWGVISVFVLLLVALALLYTALSRKTRSLQEAQQLLVSKNEQLMQSDRKSKQLLQQYVQAMNEKQQKPTATHAPADEPQADDVAEDKDKQQGERTGVAMNEEQRNRLLNSITTVMEDVSIISNSNFNLSMLAEMVESNTKYVSWIINETYHKNFKTLLNEYRIREACKRLYDKKHYGNMTIQAIYEELGYNSAASFIQAFKKVNGMTPSVYQKLKAQETDATKE